MGNLQKLIEASKWNFDKLVVTEWNP